MSDIKLQLAIWLPYLTIKGLIVLALFAHQYPNGERERGVRPVMLSISIAAITGLAVAAIGFCLLYRYSSNYEDEDGSPYP